MKLTPREQRAVDPGERSTLDEALPAQLEALELLSFIRRLNRKPAARHYRMNSWSPEAIVGMPFLAVELFKNRGKRKDRSDDLDRIFTYAWHNFPRSGRAKKLAELFDCSPKHVRKTADRLGLR